MVRVWVLALCALAAFAGLAAPAIAAALPCHALAPAGSPPAPRAVAALSYDCGPEAGDFRNKWIWFRLTPPPDGAERNLIVRPTRVDGLRVVVAYADGSFTTDDVRDGAYGDHWSMDNRVSFDLETRTAPVIAVYLGADNLRFAGSLAPQLMDASTARRTSAISAMLIGASLALLFASFIYNGFRLVAQRQRALAGHVLWALLLFLWGLLISQVALYPFPGLAGTWSARLATVLASGALTAAAWLFTAMIEPGIFGRGVRRAIVAAGVLPLLFALATVWELGDYTAMMEPLVNGAAVVPIVVVAVCAGVAIARGSWAAREFTFAWLVPMLAVLLTSVADIGLIPGASGQMSVLVASALQTILLSMTMTMRLAQVRIERDSARAAGAEYQKMALTDPMTGLLNRRGFVGVVGGMLGGREPVGLALLDLDHFKSINDSFGHLAGDEVLARVGAALAEVCPPHGVAGRLGGEEFGIAAPCLSGVALAQCAEAVRRAIAAIDLTPVLGDRRIACSIGIADSGAGRTSFDTLFRAADDALYDAKRRGRDRVVAAKLKPVAITA